MQYLISDLAIKALSIIAEQAMAYGVSVARLAIIGMVDNNKTV